MKNTRILALGLALAIGATSGCHSAHGRHWDWSDQDSNDDSDDEMLGVAVLLGAVLLIAIPVAIINSLSQSPATTPTRTRSLHALRGGLVDVDGRPVAGATLTVRAAKSYTAAPEKLPAVTMASGPDGSYLIPMVKENALCVDVTAEGKQPLRRWFIVLVPGALKSLPADQREIIFVSPYETEADVARMTLVPGN